MKVPIKVKILDNKVYEWGLPKYATEGSAGLDLVACIHNPVTLLPGERKLLNTGIAIHIEEKGYAGYVLARSGLASKRGICLSNGVGLIDSDYTDELKVALVNLSTQEQIINPGDRIAQFVVMPVVQIEWTETNELEKTARLGGFGSTGVGEMNL